MTPRRKCYFCKSSEVEQINIENQIKFQCRTCGIRSGQVLEVDGKIRAIRTEEGIKHFSTAAIIINDEKMLMTDRRAAPYGISLPVGHWEYADDTLEDALRREIFEETGLRVINQNHLLKIVLPYSECRAGSDIEVWYVYEAFCSDYSHLTINEENVELVWIPLKELTKTSMTDQTRYTLCLLGYINDPDYVEKQEKRRGIRPTASAATTTDF